MSETEKDESLADAVFDEAPAEPEEVEAQASGKRSKGAGASVAWLALFLSLITVAGVGYLVIEKMRAEGSAQESDQRVASLSGRLSSADESLSRLDSSISDLESADSRNAASIDSLQGNWNNERNCSTPCRRGCLRLNALSRHCRAYPSMPATLTWSPRPSTTCRSPMLSCNSRAIPTSHPLRSAKPTTGCCSWPTPA